MKITRVAILLVLSLGAKAMGNFRKRGQTAVEIANACHVAAKHLLIQIAVPCVDDSQWNQDFGSHP